MKKLTPGKIIALTLSVIALIVACFVGANILGETNQASAGGHSSSVAPSSKKEETTSTKSALGDYFEEDDKFTERSNKSASKIITASEDEAGFELFKIEEIENDEMKVSPSRKGENAIRADFPQAAMSQILWDARHNVVAFENLARQYGFQLPSKIAEERDDRRFLTKEAQNVYLDIEKIFVEAAKNGKVESGKFDIMKNTISTGMGKGGELIQDSRPQDWSDHEMLKVTYDVDGDGKDNALYHNYYCENAQLPRPYKSVPSKPIPTPPTPPKETPPVEAKDPKKDPAQQGNAPVGGGQNAEPVITEPASETQPSFAPSYEAPQAPQAPTQQQAQSSTRPSSTGGGWTGVGSGGGYSTSNNGAVTAPDPADNRPSFTEQPTPTVEPGANSPEPDFSGNGEFTPED